MLAPFLLVPALEAIGATAALATVLEVFVGAEVAAAAATAAVAVGSSKVGAKADNAIKDAALDQLPDWVKKLPENVQRDYKLISGYMATRDPTEILQAAKDKYAEENPVPLVEPTVGYSTQPTNGLVVRPRRYVDSAVYTDNSTGPVVYEKVPYAEVSQVIPGGQVDPGGPGGPDEPMTVTARRNVGAAGSRTSSLAMSQALSNPYDKNQLGPRDIARMLIDTSRELAASGDPIKANLTVLETNPEGITLFTKLTTFFAEKAKKLSDQASLLASDAAVAISTPKTSEFMKVSARYNGKSINYSSFTIARNPETWLIEVTGVDETGTAFTLPQNTGTILPSVPGTVFMGPLSRNDELPSEDRVEDFFAFFHDYSWSGGKNFNRLGDLQFISRLSQNMDRVKPEHRALVTATIMYFSSVSLAIGLLKGEKIVDMGNEIPLAEVVEEPEEDIYDILGTPEIGTREEFFKVMDEELTNYQATDGFFTNYRKTLPDTLWEELEIEIN